MKTKSVGYSMFAAIIVLIAVVLCIWLIPHKKSIDLELDGYYCSTNHEGYSKAGIKIEGIAEYRKLSIESFNGTIAFENINAMPDPVSVWIQFGGDSKSGSVFEQKEATQTQDWGFIGSVITDQFDSIIFLFCDSNDGLLYLYYFIAPVESIDNIDKIAKQFAENTVFSKFDW